MKRRAFLAALFACTFICGCWKSCDYATLSETKSPDGKLKAVVFERGCGSKPIDSSVQISILSNSQPPPWGCGNVFISGDENHAAPANGKPPIEINVRWESNSSLVISYPKNAPAFLKKPRVAGVAISYETVP